MKKIIIISILLSGSMWLEVNTYADVVYLKSGGKIEGKILSVSEDGYELKVRAGKVFVKKKDVERVEEKDVDLSKIYSPLEQYTLRLSKIDPYSAEAHFQLGMFCLENKLYEEASNEFRLAKELDISFAQKVNEQFKIIEDLRGKDNYLKQKEDINEILNKEEQFEREIRPQLNPMRQYNPNSTFDTDGFKMYLDTFKDEDKKTEYLRDCFSKAQKIEKEVLPGTDIPTARQKLLLALDLYKSASFCKEPEINNSAKESITRLIKRLIEPEREKLSIPIGRLYNEINEFLATLSIDEAQNYCNSYLKMGETLEQEANSLSVGSEDFKLRLRAALNCYLIVYNFTNVEATRKEVLTSIKRCNKRL